MSAPGGLFDRRISFVWISPETVFLPRVRVCARVRVRVRVRVRACVCARVRVCVCVCVCACARLVAWFTSCANGRVHTGLYLRETEWSNAVILTPGPGEPQGLLVLVFALLSAPIQIQETR